MEYINEKYTKKVVVIIDEYEMPVTKNLDQPRLA